MDLNNSVPSLVDQAAHKIAVLLWTVPTADDKTQQEKEPCLTIRRRVRTLNLPIGLGKKVVEATYRVQFEIRTNRLIETTNAEEDAYIRSFDSKLCWSVDGSIDKLKSASLVASDRSMNVRFRYEVACDYCLEDAMDSLWEEMSHEERTYMYQMNSPLFFGTFFSSFWTCYKRGKMEVIMERVRRDARYETVDHYGFCMAIEFGIEAAMEFFWPRLKRRQRALHLALTLKGKPSIQDFPILGFPIQGSTINPFLMSKLKRSQQKKLFKKHGFRVLDSLSKWWRYDMFSKAAPFCVPYINPEQYMFLFYEAYAHKRAFSEILCNFWQSAPPEYRAECLRTPGFSNSAFNIFVLNDQEDMVQLMLREMAALSRKYAFAKIMSTLALDCTIRNGNWRMLEVVAYGLVNSSEERTRLLLKLESVCDGTTDVDPVLVEEYQREVKPRISRRLMDKVTQAI